jgi:small-conductance mechanosensitive channel
MKEFRAREAVTMNRNGLGFGKMACLVLLVALFLSAGQFRHLSWAAAEGTAVQKQESSTQSLSLSDDVQKAAEEHITREKKALASRVRPLLNPEPLGFNLQTIRRVWRGLLALPSKIPVFVDQVREASRLLGLVGSLVLLAFLVALFYTFFGQKKVLQKFERALEPLRSRVPSSLEPYFLSIARILTASLIPLILFALFGLIRAFLPYEAGWLNLTGRLLRLWTIGALVISFLREVLTREHIPIPKSSGLSIFRVARFITLYSLISIAVFWSLQVFNIPKDVLALLKFLVSLTIVFAFLLLLLKKKSIMTLLPDLPYRSYRIFVQGLERLYYPAMFYTFLTGLLWCFGYHALCEVLWKKTWAVVGVFVGIMVCYHAIRQLINRWFKRQHKTDEAARFLFKSFRAVLLYVTIAVLLVSILSLLGLLEPAQRVLSFPVAVVGQTPLSLWVFIKAALIILAFVLFSRLLRAWLDYRVYPHTGVEEGLAYAINTFLNYLFLALGILFSMRAVGLDLRVLVVLAGAMGIGIGLGLQNVAANLVSSFILVFGRRIKKGDWIQVGDTVGSVREVRLAATRIWTRDNIEYLVPNSTLTSNMITNYSLSDPLIRIHVPVGVSYKSDPARVTDILLKAAAENESVSKQREAKVWFTEYADSSLNFELLVWVDIRQVSRKAVRSELYYTIFQAFAEAGIEIPYPQRDIHIRSGLRPEKESAKGESS